MQKHHDRILHTIAEAELEEPSLRGKIPVTTVLWPKLCGIFDHQGQLGQEIRELSHRGFIKIQGGKNLLGKVSLTELGKDQLRKNYQ